MTDKLKEALEHFGWLRDNAYLTEEAILYVGKLEQAQALNARLVEAARAVIKGKATGQERDGIWYTIRTEPVDALEAAVAEGAQEEEG